MTRGGRPNRATVARLLASQDQTVRMGQSELIEDADGDPAGVSTTYTDATLIVSLPLLGWTQDEYDDPSIEE